MIIPCPQCHARLSLPVEAEDQMVRCPTCRHAFVARTEEAPPRPVIAPAPRRLPREEAEPPPYREDDSDRRVDRKILQENAREHTRLAGLLMMTAFLVTLADLVILRGIDFWQELDQGLGDRETMALLIIGVIARVVVFLPLLIFLYLGGRHLLRAGSHNLVVAGTVISFLLASLFVLGILFSVFSIVAEIAGPIEITTVALIFNAACAALNLVAGVTAARALAQPDVKEHFALQLPYRPRERYSYPGRRR